MRTATGYRHVRDRACQLRSHQTPAELRLWELLRNRRCGGLRFLRQRPLGQYIVDFYCPARKLAVEVDGQIHEETEVWAYDALRQHALEEQGITVIRLANDEVLRTPGERVQARILASMPPTP